MGKKLVLLSDVHGNLEALLATLVWLWSKKLAKNWEYTIINLGDSVNYCADSEGVMRVFRILGGSAPIFYEAGFIEKLAEGWPKETERALVKAALIGLAGTLGVIIKGDHEDLVLGYDDVGSFKVDAKADLEYTRQSLSAVSISQLEALPTHVLHSLGGRLLRQEFEVPGKESSRICSGGSPYFQFVHGLPLAKVTYTVKGEGDAGSKEVQKPGWRDGYLFPEAKAAEFITAARAVRGQICFLGQTHKAMCVSVNPEKGCVERIDLEWGIPILVAPSADQVIFINPGSLGQPRDGQSDIPLSVKMTSFGLFDLEALTFTNARIPYPIGATQNRMRAAGLSERNIMRLALGQ